MFKPSNVQFCQLHKSQTCIGFCAQINCPSSSIFCEKCLEEDHRDHLESCKEFGQINKDLLNSIRKKKNHLTKVKEKYIQLNQLNTYQIETYEQQIGDLRNIQGNFLKKKYNSFSIQQTKLLKDSCALEAELDDGNFQQFFSKYAMSIYITIYKLNQIEQLTQSLELIKKDFLANQDRKFTSILVITILFEEFMVNNLLKGSSLCMKIFKILVLIMYIYLFITGATLILLLIVGIDDDDQSKKYQKPANYESIRYQTQYLTQGDQSEKGLRICLFLQRKCSILIDIKQKQYQNYNILKTHSQIIMKPQFQILRAMPFTQIKDMLYYRLILKCNNQIETF